MKSVVFSILTLVAVTGWTEEKKSTNSQDSLVSKFRCEKLRSNSLAEVKMKMIENCNLDKPFSTSMSVFAGDESYMYCCHTN